MGVVRTKSRKDSNHKQIVDGLRRYGATVLDTSQLKNCFDILVGYNGVNYIIEIKDGKKSKSQTKLTDGEKDFKNTWKGGKYHIAYSLDQAIEIIENN